MQYKESGHMVNTSGRGYWRTGLCVAAQVAIAIAAAGLGASLAAQEAPSAPPAVQGKPDMTVDSLSVVKVKSKAVANARSTRALGTQREGTGVVIDSDGLVLTIGYLITEAETVELLTADGKSFPATVVGYDNATG